MNGLVRPFAARVIAAADEGSSISGAGSTNAITSTSANGLPGAGSASPAAGGAAAVSSPFARNVRATPGASSI